MIKQPLENNTDIVTKVLNCPHQLSAIIDPTIEKKYAEKT